MPTTEGDHTSKGRESNAPARPVTIPTCRHWKDDGVQCGSPAMRGKQFCYFHDRQRRDHPNRRPRTVTRPRKVIDLPPFTDRRSILDALSRISNGVFNNEIAPDDANALIYAIQTALLSL